MTFEQATDLAARTLAAIDHREASRGHLPRYAAHIAADRERVASDLAGLVDHPLDCDRWHRPPGFDSCPDAARYTDGLRRTAALYGVTENADSRPSS